MSPAIGAFVFLSWEGVLEKWRDILKGPYSYCQGQNPGAVAEYREGVLVLLFLNRIFLIVNPLTAINHNFLLQSDLMAGMSVAALVIPQGMSYARLAGLPSVFGLYGAFVPVLCYAALGSSRHLVSSMFFGSLRVQLEACVFQAQARARARACVCVCVCVCVCAQPCAAQCVSVVRPWHRHICITGKE